MAHLYEHCYDCERWLGRDWEEVHKWFDELFAEYGPAHRCHRHHIEGIEEVRQQWGDEAAIAAKIHILVDCWGIPGKTDYVKIVSSINSAKKRLYLGGSLDDDQSLPA